MFMQFFADVSTNFLKLHVLEISGVFLVHFSFSALIFSLFFFIQALNGGLVMVSFYNYFLTCTSTATLQDVIAHISHIRTVAGIDYVGIGAGYDGINQ